MSVLDLVRIGVIKKQIFQLQEIVFFMCDYFYYSFLIVFYDVFERVDWSGFM